MKLIKRLIMLLLALVLAIGVFAGCKGNGSTSMGGQEGVIHSSMLLSNKVIEFPPFTALL